MRPSTKIVLLCCFGAAFVLLFAARRVAVDAPAGSGSAVVSSPIGSSPNGVAASAIGGTLTPPLFRVDDGSAVRRRPRSTQPSAVFLPRLPSTSTSDKDTGVPVGDMLFYRLLAAGRAEAVTSDAVLRGSVTIAKEPPRHPIAAQQVAVLRERSSALGCDAAAQRVPLALCAVSRDAAKVTLEWVVWHYLVGVRSLLVIDDSDDGGSAVRTALGDLVTLGIVALNATGGRPGEPRSVVQRRAANLCAEFASERRAAALSLMLPTEFFLSPAHDCLLTSSLREGLESLFGDDRERTSDDKGLTPPRALAVPTTVVGHGGQYIDTSRSQFERSNFVGGDPATVSGVRVIIPTSVALTSDEESMVLPSAPLATPPSATHLRTAMVCQRSDGRALAAAADPSLGVGFPIMSAGATDWRSECRFNDSSLRVVRFQQRSLAAALRDALTSGDDDLGGGSAIPFSLGGVHQVWRSHEMTGFSPLSAAGTARLLRLHEAMLVALGFPPSRRRERIEPSRRPVDARVQANLLAAGAVAAVAGARANATTIPRLSAYELVRREFYALDKEPLARPITSRQVEMTVARDRCRSSPAPVNVTFCAYVRNRAKITAEWVLYHRLMGVQRYIIFDDDSDDGLREALAPLIASGIVDLRQSPTPPYYFKGRPVKGGLLAAYAECDMMVAARDAAERTKSPSWLGFIDSDEFVNLQLHECLHDLLADAVTRAANGGSHVGAVALPWVEVSHRGELVDRFPTQLNRTNFAAGEHDPYERVKCVARAGLTVRMDTAHRTFFDGPWTVVAADGNVVQGEGWFSGVNHRTAAFGKATLIHYHARTLASWLQRSLDGFADDDNKVWPFDLDESIHRWRGAHGKGFKESLRPSSTMVKFHEDLASALGY